MQFPHLLSGETKLAVCSITHQRLKRLESNTVIFGLKLKGPLAKMIVLEPIVNDLLRVTIAFDLAATIVLLITIMIKMHV